MQTFAKGMPRWVVLLGALAAFCLVPPETLAKGPNLCVWRHLFNLSACPACGSTRALAAFFHGRIADALAFNCNVLVTAPCLLGMLALDALDALRKVRGTLRARLNSSPRLN